MTNSVIKWINKHFRQVFLLLLIGVLVTGSLTSRDGYLLKTEHAPSGILSWEINLKNTDQQSILKEWQISCKKYRVYTDEDTFPVKVDGLETALTQNNADYWFILFYVLLLLLLFVRIGWNKSVRNDTDLIRHKETALFVSLSVIAGLMDVLENIGTWRVIKHWQLPAREYLPALIVGIPSLIKWSLLLIVVIRLVYEAIRLNKPRLWLGMFSSWMATLVKYAWRFRIVLFALLGLFLVLNISDQGQDLLLSINTSPRGSIYFLIVTTIIALLCWHLPKAVDNAASVSYRQFFLGPVDFDTNALPGQNRPSGKVDIARLLGVAGFLIPAEGILHTMNVYHVYNPLNFLPPIILLTALLVLNTVVLQHHWIDHFYKRGNTVIFSRYIISMAVLLAPVICFGFAGKNHQPYFLAYLSLDLILLSAVFLINATLRTCVTSISNWKIAPWITFSGIFCMLFFIACNFPSFLNVLTLNDRFYTMPVVFCAVAGYLLVFAFLMFLGKKTGIQWVSLLLLLTMYRSMTAITPFHKVALVNKKDYHKSLDSLDQYVKQWLISRKQEIIDFRTNHPNKSYPVFFVNAYGGGIRASVWTTMVVGTLDSLFRRETTGLVNAKGFQHYVFSYSGASGGTIGLALLCGARYTYLRNLSADSILYPEKSLKVYRNDYLTADVVALLGRDLVMSCLGLASWEDRARLMEKDWERHTTPKGIHLDSPLSRIWKDGSGEIPLLFSNTYDINTGYKGIVAPVLLDTLDFPDTILPEQELKPTDDMRLSTAAFLSARFPYVSPTGKLNEKHHFTDGGTKENSGAETSLQVFTVFKRVVDRLCLTDTIYKNVRPHFFSLLNSVDASMDSLGKTENLYEVIAPPLGILNSLDGNSSKADATNKALAIRNHYGYYIFRPTPEKVPNSSIWPVLPLGWQISDYAMTQMELSARREGSILDCVLLQLGLTGRKKK